MEQLIREFLNNRQSERKNKSIEDYKKEFFAKLTETDKKAHHLTFNSILNELHILQGHDDVEVVDNWFSHFIQFHDEAMNRLFTDSEEAINNVVKLYGETYIEDVFDSNEKSLESLMGECAEWYGKALITQADKDYIQEEALKQKIKEQLKALEDSLIELTNDSPADKIEIEIGTENASYSIKLKTKREREGISFEEMINSLFGIKI